MVKDIIVSRNDTIATIFLNKPEQLNALNRAMWQDLGDICASLGREPNLHCLILSSKMGKAFATGADIKAFTTERDTQEHTILYDCAMRQTLLTIYKHPYPTITAINGLCFGGAIALTAVTDIRLCSQGSHFCIPASRLGLPMPMPEIGTIVRIIGSANTSRLLLNTQMLNAEEALNTGIVSRIVVNKQIEEEAISIAQNITSGAPLVNRWHKRFIHRLSDPRVTTDFELKECYKFLETRDYTEGLNAFREKRLSSFTGT